MCVTIKNSQNLSRQHEKYYKVLLNSQFFQFQVSQQEL